MTIKTTNISVVDNAYTLVASGKATIQAASRGLFKLVLTDAESAPAADATGFIAFGRDQGLASAVAVPAGRYAYVKYQGDDGAPSVTVHDESDL